MGQYKSQYTGPQIDAGINAALNPDVAVTPDSDALVTSGAVADALDNIDPTITSDTDTTLNGILVGNGSKVGTKSLDTSSLTDDANHVPVSSVVKSALDNKADASSLSGILISRKFSTTFSAAPGADGFQFYITAAPQGYTPIFACVETFQGPVISSIASNITKSTTSVVIGIYNCITSNYTATYFLRILYMKDEFVTTTAFDS